MGAVLSERLRALNASRLTFMVLVLLGSAAGVISLLGVFVGGIGWDVEFDVGAYLQVVQMSGAESLQEAYDSIVWTSEFYGLLVPQIAEGIWSAIGLSGEFGPGNLSVYRLLAVLNVLLAMLGAAALAAAVWAALRSRVAAAFAWAVLMTFPLWNGLAQLDWKDVPIAVGVSLVSAGLVFSYALDSRRRRLVFGGLVTASGATLAIASRPGSWPVVVAVMAAAVGTYVLASLISGKKERAVVVGVVAASALAATAIALWVSNPIARLGLGRWLLDSALVSQNNPWWGVVRTNGIDVNVANLPLWYPVAWLLAQSPLMTGVAIGISVVGLIASTLRLPRSVPLSQFLALSPLAWQGALVPVLVVLTRPVIYDGLRRILFFIPALLALAAVGVAWLERLAGASKQDRSTKVVNYVTAVTITIASLWGVIRWFSYQYAFLKPVAGRNPEARDWELDYWGATAIEGFERLREMGLIPIVVEPTEATARSIGAISRDALDADTSDFGLYVFYRGESGVNGCRSLFTISRDGHVLGEGAVCSREVAGE